MGEARRRAEYQQQIMNVDLKNATQRVCTCGCKYFMPAIEAFTISAIVSPVGKELTVQRPALICMECKTVLQIEST